MLALALAATGSASSSGGKIRVVAAENVWGNLAAQLGGDRVDVTSIVTSPSADPHDYEPTGLDARTLAGAQLAIVNGIGYDEWASKLLAANPVHGRLVLEVGRLLGFGRGANPHRWYSPGDVQTVIGEIYNDYIRARPEGHDVLPRAGDGLRDPGPGTVQAADRDHPPTLPRRPGRRL